MSTWNKLSVVMMIIMILSIFRNHKQSGVKRNLALAKTANELWYYSVWFSCH